MAVHRRYTRAVAGLSLDLSRPTRYPTFMRKTSIYSTAQAGTASPTCRGGAVARRRSCGARCQRTNRCAPRRGIGDLPVTDHLADRQAILSLPYSGSGPPGRGGTSGADTGSSITSSRGLRPVPCPALLPALFELQSELAPLFAPGPGQLRDAS